MDRKEAFVAAFIFDTLPENFEKISREAARFAQHFAPRIAGLIEITVLGNEKRTRLLVFTRWESKMAWGRSRWDEEAGKTLAELVQSAQSFDVETFVPVAVEQQTPPAP
jgi:heme-degrading monooxygenase HmoA